MHPQHVTALSCLFYLFYFSTLLIPMTKNPTMTTSLHSRTPEDESEKIVTTTVMTM